MRTSEQIEADVRAFEARQEDIEEKQTAMFARHDALFAEQASVGADIERLSTRSRTFAKKRLTERKRLLILAWIAGTAFVAQVLGRSAVDAGARLDRIYQWVSVNPVRITGAVLGLFLLAQLASAVRRRKRVHYGAFEIGTAMAVAYPTFEHPRDGAFQTAALVGILYFLVRGLENVHAGTTAELEALDKRAVADLEERQAILDELAALDTRRKSIRSRIDMANEESDALQREISAFGTDFDRFREELGLPSRHRTDRHLGDKQVDDK